MVRSERGCALELSPRGGLAGKRGALVIDNSSENTWNCYGHEGEFSW
jgi:hypothetical protein